MILAFTVMAALLIVSAALLFVPWSDKRGIERDTLNQQIYRQRLKELDENRDAVGPEQREAVIAELQKNLLDDIPETEITKSSRPGGWAYLPGVVLLCAATLGLFIKTNGVMQVNAWQQATAQTPALLSRVMDPASPPLAMADLSVLALGLRTRLQQEPQHLDSWLMLGRLGMVLNNYTLAAQAFERAWRMAPQNSAVKTAYAEILLRSPDPADNRQGELLLDELLKADSTNVQVLGLIAFNDFSHQRYQRAIDGWQIVLRLLPANDERRAMIERGIAQARAEQKMTEK